MKMIKLNQRTISRNILFATILSIALIYNLSNAIAAKTCEEASLQSDLDYCSALENLREIEKDCVDLNKNFSKPNSVTCGNNSRQAELEENAIFAARYLEHFFRNRDAYELLEVKASPFNILCMKYKTTNQNGGWNSNAAILEADGISMKIQGLPLGRLEKEYMFSNDEVTNIWNKKCLMGDNYSSFVKKDIEKK